MRWRARLSHFFSCSQILIVWTKMANDIIGPIYRNGMNWRLGMVVDFKYDMNTFRLMYLLFVNSIGTLFYIIFNYHRYDNALTTILVSYYLLGMNWRLGMVVDDKYDMNTFRLMYLMFVISIGTLFNYIFNYHHYDNALTTALVSYFLYQYWRYRIGNNWRRYIWHEYLSIDVSYVWYFDRYVILIYF